MKPGYYTAVIEAPDGYTYTQQYCGIDGLIELLEMLGSLYWIVEIF